VIARPDEKDEATSPLPQKEKPEPKIPYTDFMTMLKLIAAASPS
jgi:hypothetical protein